MFLMSYYGIKRFPSIAVDVIVSILFIALSNFFFVDTESETKFLFDVDA